MFAKTLSAVMAAVTAFALVFAVSAGASLPDSFYIQPGQELQLPAPYGARMVYPESVAVSGLSGVTQAPQKAELSILGIVPIKTVELVSKERRYAIPCGTPFGIKLYTAGVIICGMADIDAPLGNVNPAREAGLREGDVIVRIADRKMNTTEDLAAAFEGSDGTALSIVYKRDGVEFSTVLRPALSQGEQKYKAGLWVRDSSAGIGTMTLYDPVASIYAGLGHAVCDVDTGKIMPLQSGTAVPVTITGYYKAKSGTPGELCGVFHNEEPLGKLVQNGETGVYGKLDKIKKNLKAMPVAYKQEIVEGPAQIMTTIDGEEPKLWKAEISKIYYTSESVQKNMVIKITDKELLEKTGGIVQGMSGSPIIQNGSLVGAVTHVFVNNPAQGYGIFAENMVDTIERYTGKGIE